MADDDTPTPLSNAHIRKEIADALYLLEYAITIGFKTKEGGAIPLPLTTAIKMAAAKAAAAPRTDDAEPVGLKILTPEDWIAFEMAYYELALLLSPVTADTLRATEDTGRALLFGVAPAQAFTRWLWAITLGFAGFVIASEWSIDYWGTPALGQGDWANTIMLLVNRLIPFAYGGLGACIYLLRSAHTFIYERTFDVRRKPEYFSRIILGVVGGGAVVLFVSQVAGDKGEEIKLSSAALGFLAGYSTEFLFSTIERVIGALLPRVGLDSVKRAAGAAAPTIARPVAGLTLKDLLDRLSTAEGDDKELVRSLIAKWRERM